MKKERVDILLVEQGLFDSVEKAKRCHYGWNLLTDKTNENRYSLVKNPPYNPIERKGKY